MRESAKGVMAMAAACTVWGLSPIYYKLLAEVPPLEVLSHRTLWSALLFTLVLAAQGRLGLVPAALRGRGLAVVALAAVLISANWFLFIFSVQIGHTVEASLGYFIFPLVAVVIGLVAFGERLGLGQGLAVALAGLAVVVLTPLALIWLIGLHSGAWVEFARPGAWFGQSLGTSVMLAFSGVITAGPLILFSYAARRVSMATLGLVQYLNPSLQFVCATLIFAEPFTRWHGIAFSLIWAALTLYSWESLRQDRAARSRGVSAATSGTAVK